MVGKAYVSTFQYYDNRQHLDPHYDIEIKFQV